jgi:hypothetical protein
LVCRRRRVTPTPVKQVRWPFRTNRSHLAARVDVAALGAKAIVRCDAGPPDWLTFGAEALVSPRVCPSTQIPLMALATASACPR